MNCGRHKCQYVLFMWCQLFQLTESSEGALPSLCQNHNLDQILCMSSRTGLTTVDSLGMSICNTSKRALSGSVCKK